MTAETLKVAATINYKKQFNVLKLVPARCEVCK